MLDSHSATEETLLVTVTRPEPVSFHPIFSIIYFSAQTSTRARELSTGWMYFKKSLGTALLVTRALSILFRLYAAKEMVNVFFELPELNKTPSVVSENIGNAVALLLCIVDIIVTTRSTKKAVFSICDSANWGGQLNQFCHDIQSGLYPKKMLFSGFATMLGSASKGYSGITTIFSESLSNVPGIKNYLPYLIPPIAVITAASSALCFMLLLFCDKGLSVVRAYDGLTPSENWAAFKTHYAGLLRLNNLKGLMLNIGAALFSAIAIFYSEGHFAFNIAALLFFFPITLGTVVFNYCYSYNEINKLREVKKIHEEQACDRCENLPDNTTSRLTRVVGTISAVGDASTYMLAVVRTLQIFCYFIGWAAKNEDSWKNYAHMPFVIMAFFAASIPVAAPAGQQGWSLWTAGMLCNRKPIEEPVEEAERSVVPG